jgi:formiminotetrahydrofolate cyclodeaminase
MNEPIRRMRANREIEEQLNKLAAEDPEAAETFAHAHGFHFETAEEAAQLAELRAAIKLGKERPHLPTPAESHAHFTDMFKLGGDA